MKETRRQYTKPMMKVIKLQKRSQLLVGSGEYTLPGPIQPEDIP